MDQSQSSKAHEEVMRQELEEYEQERERVKHVIEQIRGKQQTTFNRIINYTLIVSIVVLAIIEFGFKLIPPILALEIGILLVSLKIIWMMYLQEKANHFQFWILNSLEIRLNEMSRRVRNIEKATGQPREK
jgi:hypothetical protein